MNHLFQFECCTFSVKLYYIHKIQHQLLAQQFYLLINAPTHFLLPFTPVFMYWWFLHTLLNQTAALVFSNFTLVFLKHYSTNNSTVQQAGVQFYICFSIYENQRSWDGYGTWHAWERKEMRKEITCLKHLVVDVRTILKWILRKQG